MPEQLHALLPVSARRRSHPLLVGETPRLPVQREAPGLERPGSAGHGVLQLLDDYEEQEEK